MSIFISIVVFVFLFLLWYLYLYLYCGICICICIVVFGSFRGEEGDSNSVMDLSHINQDKMLPEVSFGQPCEEDENENMMIFTQP